MLQSPTTASEVGPPRPAAMRRLGLYTPHAGQQILHDSPSRFRICAMGRRWGKSWACVNEIAKFAWENHGTLSWWVAPTYDQAKDIAFRELVARFRPAMRDLSWSELRIEWLNGSVTRIRSADVPDNLRGSGIHFLVLDECAMMQKRVWEEILRPTLATTGGRVVFISTPKGRNWFYDLFMRGQDPLHPDYTSWSFASRQNPYLRAGEWDEARNTLPRDTFRQEWMAEFLEGSAGVFRNIAGCVGGEIVGPSEGHIYILGWDPGRWQDPSVMVVVDASVKPAQVVYFDRFLGADWTVQAARCETVARHYGAMVWIDATHGSVGDPLYSFISKGDLKVQRFDFTSQSKQALVEHLILRLERHEVQFPAIPALLGELEAFERNTTPAGSVRYSAPEGLHDDCVFALALATWGACHGSGLFLMVKQEYEAQAAQKRAAFQALNA